MPSSAYFEVGSAGATSRTQIVQEDDYPSKKLSSGEIAGICIAVIVVVALALGLGLGLGLKSDDEAAVPAACYTTLQHVVTDGRQRPSPRAATRTTWSGQCPTAGSAACPSGLNSSPMIIVSLDGFRAEYLERGLTPTLQKLAECGVHTTRMRAAFPTKTFPNHLTLVTGLYPESHGIIDNNMYDVNLQERFALSLESKYNNEWYLGEPIWNTVLKNNKTAVTMFWAGGDVNMQDMKPTHCYMYNRDVPFENRVDEILGYFDGDTADMPDFTAMYFEQPDSAGHEKGPFSDLVAGNLTYMDQIIDRLLAGLEQRNLHQCVNIIVMSDHGMQDKDCGRTVDLAPYLGDQYDRLYMYTGMSGRITSQYVADADGNIHLQETGPSTAEILAPLQCAHYNSTKDWNAQYMAKEDRAKRLHYANSHRIEEVVVDVRDQYTLMKDEENDPYYYCDGGDHGYDNSFSSMHALFVAMGPAFVQKVVAEPFENIEVYNLMADVMQLKNPAANNGTKGRLRHLLHAPGDFPTPAAPLGDYVSCPFPEDPAEREKRREAVDTCTCQDLTNYTAKSVEELDEELNLSEPEVDLAVSLHLPFGVPEVDFADASLCQLTHTDFVSGFSLQHKMALWTAFTISDDPGCSVQLDPECYKSDDYVSDCLRPDVRLTPEQQTECAHYEDAANNIHGTFMYPPGLASSSDSTFDAHVSTNLVPMYDGFRTGAWHEALTLLEEYAERYSQIHVVMGPVFDYNYDGRRDVMADIQTFLPEGTVPLPTHYFIVAFRCQDNTVDLNSCHDNLAIMSVILPHKQVPGNCWDLKYWEYMQYHMARVKDVSWLTDLRLFPDLSQEAAVSVETLLPVGLWDRISWLDLRQDATEQCPDVSMAECPAGYKAANPPVLLISLDGFRWDYMNLTAMPTLAKLRDCGVVAEHLRPIYPTMTFPNHYTITSGQYPETHGIIDNSMYDRELKENFYLGSPNAMNDHWWRGEPLWNRVEKYNKTAMAFFWPGSDVEIGGMRPTNYVPYNGKVPYELRVSTVLDWLAGAGGADTPDFITLYLSKVDEAGHEGGPASLEVEEAMEAVEKSLQQLMDGIYRLGMEKCINIIVTSDHGMTEIECDWNVVLNDYIDMAALQEKTYLWYGSAARMSNKYYRLDYVYHNLDPSDQIPIESLVQQLECQHDNMTVFDKKDLPKRHHYAKDGRIDDIIFVTDNHWMVQDFDPWCVIKGQHGWDPSIQEMKAHFTAYGPGFKDKTVVDPFESIEVYNLMAHLLDIPPGPNNGTEGSLYHVLRDPPTLPDTPASDIYGDCGFPVDDEYQRRANQTAVGCSCDPVETIEDLDDRLDLDPTDVEAYIQKHLPHGTPYHLDHDTCILVQEDFVVGFSHDLMMSAWTAFMVPASQIAVDNPDCIRPDVRLEPEEQISCSALSGGTNTTTGHFFPPAFASSELSQFDALTLSNAVPMYTEFYSGVWTTLLNHVLNWANERGEIYVITGPAFDYDGDGRRDVNMTFENKAAPIPSHFYAIVLDCDAATCPAVDYDVISFILPHRNAVSNCMSDDVFLLDNVARIRDVELLTDLEFLTLSRTPEGVRKRIFTPEALW